MMGPPRELVERNARARGLLLTVGVALDATGPGPAADDLHRWVHDVCLPVSDLEQEGRAPCGC
jgi:hypothetical protein